MKHMFRGRPTTAIFFTRGAHRGAVHSGGVHATGFRDHHLRTFDSNIL